MQKKVFTVAEAIEYQKQEYGRVVYGRDALYAIARQPIVPIIRVGKGRIFFPRSSLDILLNGMEGGA